MAAEPEVSFEDALKRLERIVGDLERGEPELSAALAKYEQGIRLLARCHHLLEGAEQAVALLEGVDAAGQPLTTPFDPATPAAPTAEPPAPTRSKRKNAAPPPDGIPY